MKLFIFLVFAFLCFPDQGLTLLGESKPNLLAIGNEILRRAEVVAKSLQTKRNSLHDQIVLLENAFDLQLLMEELEKAKDEPAVDCVAHKLIRAEYHLSMLLQNYLSKVKGAN